jgi:alpha-L-fucosidase
VNLFVEQHTFPQFKDVVQKYAPSVIFCDGEWEHTDTTWRSTELLTWLLDESPCKDEVVINDRWGNQSRHHHGGYYTTEYGSGLPNADHAWEESRGMAYSYGYNRLESLKDYTSSQEMIYMLIDIVSRGGNFLLDIGPSADGQIPGIMQQRLHDIGQWLKVNGEAIYGTTTWKRSEQWSEGIVKEAERGEYKTNYNVMKLTVSPDPGYAAKTIFFTRKANALYCICPVFPDKQLVIKDVKLPSKAEITLLGHEGKLKWKQKGNQVEVEMPRLNPSRLPCDYAWTLKVKGV